MSAYTFSFSLLAGVGIGYYASNLPASDPEAIQSAAPAAASSIQVAQPPHPVQGPAPVLSAPLSSDLTTRDGKIYKGYTVLGHDDGYLTIMYADGGGKILLSNLPDAIQQQYGYDPVKAAAAVKAVEDADKAQALTVARAQTAASIATAKQQMAVPVMAADTSASLSATLSENQAAAIRNQIASLQSQINELQKQARNAQQQDTLDFQATRYANNGHIEHRYTNAGGGQIVADTSSQIADLQDQIAALQSQLNAGATSPVAPLNPSTGSQSRDSLVGNK